MAVDPLWLAVGIVGGVIGTAVVMEAMGRVRRLDPIASTKLTTGWSLRELGKPVIVARDIVSVEVPPGTLVFASGQVDPTLLKTCEVHQVPEVRGEFALDRERDRAILFLGGLAEGGLALITVDEAMLQRLESEWRMLASRSGAYVERLSVGELAGRTGVTVETQGLVQDVLPYRDRFMIRLEDAGHIIGVLVSKDPQDLRDERILVRGGLERDETGYAVIEASEIRRIR